MPELLIELFSEEIPARMQSRAEADLAKLLSEKLIAAGLEPKAVRTASGPRRLAFAADLPEASADVREAKKGPRVGAPEQAIAGFLRGAGLSSIDQAQVVKDPKGDFYEAVIERPGRATADVVAEALPAVIAAFPWPKSMRTGTGELRWVRPLQRILCAFDDKPVSVAVEGVESGIFTSGHRFHAPTPFKATRFADYTAKLLDARVIADRAARKSKILESAKAACAARGLELVEDLGLLEEVAGLVEWPVVVVGDMDPAFLDLPAEVIRLTMRTHQRYFAVRDPKTGALAPYFLTLANIEAKDAGVAIAKGNARVLSARLNDARFFWAKDGETALCTDERREKLKSIVFHAKLGSVWAKVERVRLLGKDLCSVTGADPALVDEAALNCKMDLVTETVGEFPELQGQIGRQLYKGHPSVAVAIEDHYRPLGPNDRVPTDPVAVTLALADKLDTLAGFWAIDEKPTGSSDPYALRRAALGVLRLVFANKLGIELRAGSLLENHVPRFGLQGKQAYLDFAEDLNLLTFGFLQDRLEVFLRDEGFAISHCRAAFSATMSGWNPADLRRRVEALSAFLKTDDGKNLLAGFKRAANILAAEDKKGQGVASDWRLEQKALKETAEKALHTALGAALPTAAAAVQSEDFAAAMSALSKLRAPVDAFFEGVMVNADDAQTRRNRLLLLQQFVDGVGAVADFSKIEG